MIMLDITGKENVSFLDFKKEWKIQASTIAKRCKNKIREVVENIDLQPNPEKQVIAFSLGQYSTFFLFSMNKAKNDQFQ